MVSGTPLYEVVEAKEREAVYYQSRSEKQPFRDWRSGFRDIKTKTAIDAKITRLRSGNVGDSRSVGEGVSEAEIDLGPGYRIYYGIYGEKIILLCGGDKHTQDNDIKLAKEFWADYKRRVREREIK
jgi:putative addiction module killer protein